MSYGLRYYSEFSGKRGTKTRIEIRQKIKADDTGAEFVALPSNPLVWTLPDRDRYEPFASRGVKIRVRNTIAQGFLYFADLFGGGETDHKIIIKRDNVNPSFPSTLYTVFEGYVLPEVYEGNFSALPHNVTISATDRLGILDQVKPTITNDDVKLSDLVTEALATTGLSLNLAVGARIFADGQTEDNLNTYLNQTFLEGLGLSQENGEAYNYKELLEAILKPFTCRISQGYINGGLYWIIDRIPELNDTSRTFVTYDTNGDYLSNFSHTPKKLTLLTDADVINNAPAIQYQSGFKNVEVEQKLVKKTSLINNDPDDFANAQDFATTAVISPLLNHWGKNDHVNPTLWQVGGSKIGLGWTPLQTDYDNDYPVATALNMGSVATRFRFTFSHENEELKLNIKAIFTDSLYTLADNPRTLFGIYELYIIGVGYVVQNWTDGKPDGTFSIAQAGDLKRITKRAVIPEDASNYEERTADLGVNIPLADVLGTSYGDFDAYFRIAPFRKQDNYDNNDLDDSVLHFYNVPLTELGVSIVNADDQDNVTTGVINTDYTRTKKESFLFGDIENLNYKNGFLNSSGNRLTGWREQGETGYLPIVERYILDVFQTYNKARFSMSLEVKTTENINLYDLIEDDQITNKIYYISGLSYNAKAEVYRLTLNEFIKNDGVAIA